MRCSGIQNTRTKQYRKGRKSLRSNDFAQNRFKVHERKNGGKSKIAWMKRRKLEKGWNPMIGEVDHGFGREEGKECDLGLEVDREELSRGRVDLAQSGLAHCFSLHLQLIFDRNCSWLRTTNQIDDCFERGSAFIEQCLAARLFADCVLAERHEIRLEVRNSSAQLQ